MEETKEKKKTDRKEYLRLRKRESRAREKDNDLHIKEVKVNSEDLKLLKEVGIQKLLEVYRASLTDSENSDN